MLSANKRESSKSNSCLKKTKSLNEVRCQYTFMEFKQINFTVFLTNMCVPAVHVNNKNILVYVLSYLLSEFNNDFYLSEYIFSNDCFPVLKT